VRRLAAGLAALGVSRGETVGLMMVNRPGFHLCDTAAMHLGAAPFSVYNTAPAAQIADVFGNAGNRVVCCEAQFVDRVREAGGAVEHVVCVDAAVDAAVEGAVEGAIGLGELEELGDPAFAFDAAWRAVGPEDLLTLIYTSGTTGPPKGVELTHANMLAQMAALDGVLEIRPGDRVLSYLPSAHVADRWFSHYIGMTVGTQVTCVPDPKQLFGVLPQVRPTCWGGVPRIFERLKAVLDARFASEPDAQRRAGVAWALDVGVRKVRAEQAAVAGTGSGPDDALLAEYAKADTALCAPLRRQLGLDQVRSSVSGAAPLSLAPGRPRPGRGGAVDRGDVVDHRRRVD
jgi:long-subunit acyl-CoA synthetase (AMP-forming)